MSRSVLLTGAFGNIGCYALQELLAQGYRVVAFDKDSPPSRQNARRFSDPAIRIVWGDITDANCVRSALEGVDAVIHLAGIFPPLSENNPKLSAAVNVQGTQNIIDAMEQSGTAKRLVFASSIAVYGKQQGKIPPPLKSSDPLSPDDVYGQHKAECEQRIRNSSLQWSLLRISACPPAQIHSMASFVGAPILENHPDSRLEVVHPADAALAFVNAVSCDEAIGKILLLGGGEKNRMTTLDLFNIMASSAGLAPLPREVFNITEKIIFHGDWLDTEESQRLLKFQRYDARQLYQDFWNSSRAAKIGLVLMKPLLPLLHWAIRKGSPYYKKQVNR